MTKGMQKVKDLLLLRKCSDRTISNYLSCINRFKNHEKVTLKKEELNFGIFNSSSSNVPMLYSEDNFTRLALRGLAC